MNKEYFKDFDAWNLYKKDLDARAFDVLFNEREIWWCALGINIGSEQDGKNDLFERPVLILKKVNKDRVIVIPITSRMDPRRDRIMISVLGRESQLLLSQIRTASSKRLLRRIQRIKTATFKSIIIAVAKYILEIDQSETPPSGGESRVPEATVDEL